MSSLKRSTESGEAPPYDLKVSAYERVASMLVALLILLGTTVGVLLMVWLGSRIFATQTTVPVEMVELGTGSGPLGEGMDLQTPDMEQIGQQLEFDQPETSQTLAQIATAVVDQPLLDDLFASLPPQGGSRGRGQGLGGGVSGGGGSGQTRRWEIAFDKGNTLETYARQLDFFRIELGVLLPDNRVQYAWNLAKATPDTRIGPADQEKRYYLTWRRGELQQADVELLAKAGIAAEGKLVLKFLPVEVEATLVQLEKAYARGRQLEVRSTRFGVKTQGDGYGFFVIEQTYR